MNSEEKYPVSAPIGGVFGGGEGGSNRAATFAFRSVTHVNTPATVLGMRYLQDLLHVQLNFPGHAQASHFVPLFGAWLGLALGIRAIRSGAAKFRLYRVKLRILRYRLRALRENLAQMWENLTRKPGEESVTFTRIEESVIFTMPTANDGGNGIVDDRPEYRR